MDEDGSIYFIEMNTRIQVEHCVTEMVTGVDLVKAQLRIAAGEKLGDIVPEVPKINGHAIECRINAEHPEKFTPSPGKITVFNLPGGNGVRVDTAQYAEGVVPQYYDSLIAKLICHGKDREEAMDKMQRALSQFVVQGIHTSIPLHQRIFADEEFRSGVRSIQSSWSDSWSGKRIGELVGRCKDVSCRCCCGVSEAVSDHRQSYAGCAGIACSVLRGGDGKGRRGDWCSIGTRWGLRRRCCGARRRLPGCLRVRGRS